MDSREESNLDPSALAADVFTLSQLIDPPSYYFVTGSFTESGVSPTGYMGRLVSPSTLVSISYLRDHAILPGNPGSGPHVFAISTTLS